ncbi:MAG: glycosyltransferase, partial [candidate division WOR-3 bacterium]
MDINQSRPSGLFRRSTTILILGPLPPPYIGPAVATEMIMESELKTWFNLVHFDTSDHRSVTHIGKLDFRNISLATYHILKLPLYLIRHSPRIVYLPISQTVLGYFRDAIFILLSKVLGARVIIHLRGGYFRELYEKSTPFVKLVIRNSLKLVSRAIVLGKSLRYIFEGLVPSENIAVVPNGIDKNYITEAELDYAPRTKHYALNPLNQSNSIPQLLNYPITQLSGFKILFLSNLMLSKGFFDVIKSIPIIIKNNIPSPLMGEGKGEGESYIQFIFAGEFHEDERVKKEVFDYINTQNLSHFIKFIGMVDKEKKKELLLSADILVFPTYY